MDSSSLKQLLDGFGLLLKPQTTPYRHISCHLVDLADLLVMPGAESTVVFSLPTGLVLDVDVANQVEEIIQVRSYRDRIKLLEYSQANEEALQLLRQIPLLAVVSSGDLVQLKATTPLSAFLTGHFLKTTSLAALNPYTYQGPVTGSRFFGRQEELRTLKLQTSKSFVLSGVRRSGKTSLMLELERQLRQAPNDLIVFVNFETCQKPKDIPYLILSRLAEEVKASTRLSEWSDNLLRLASSHQWKESEHFSHLLSTIWKLIYSNEEARRLRFLFDEYDTVIGMERLYNHVFTRIWRDLVMRARSFAKGQNVPVFVQFIFAGTR
ncbi:MAG TPA: hypothetical protein VN999_10425, partial [Thermoanaerobaculia bacterium]|nr:hypothetical protein [Thermoanaerobaculia bacterium]